MGVLIKNGTVYDGRGSPPSQMDLFIEGSRIARVAPDIGVREGEIIDASGLSVAPGFIDLHRHCDVAAICDEDFGILELAQGITTAVTGNCGLAPVPSSPRYRRELHRFIEPCLGPVPEGLRLESFGQYLQALERAAPRMNLGGFAAAGAIKAAVRGYRKGAFTAPELDQARGLVAEAMEAGAFGLSMGIMYSPECYSNRQELIALAHAAGSRGGVLTCHIRGEGDRLTESVAEALAVARMAEIPLQISHFKSTGTANWRNKIFQAIELVEKARGSGQDVTVDFYPYTGGSTTLLSLIPPCVWEDSQEATLRGLSTAAGREKLRAALYRNDHPGWDNIVTGIGWQRIVVSSVASAENRNLVGHSIAALAERHGFDEPSDLVCRLLEEEQGRVAIIVWSMAQEDVDAVARLPYSMVISDSLYGKSDCPHPRLYGSFPKILREYVRERKILSMEQAIHKMTEMPARRIGLCDRGVIAPGARADLLLFQPALARDHADYDNPKRLSTGISRVLIDGKTVWSENSIVEARAGAVLRKPITTKSESLKVREKYGHL